jgi:hypothetical protein
MHCANLPLGIPEYKGAEVIEWKSSFCMAMGCHQLTILRDVLFMHGCIYIPCEVTPCCFGRGQG